MKSTRLAAATIAFLIAAPAAATSSVHCITSRRGPELVIGVGMDQTAVIFQASIFLDGREIATGTPRDAPWITNSLINPRRLRLRIASAGTRAMLVSLSARRRGIPYIGLVTYRGRTWSVRCFWDDNDAS
jgi:hypothetical protein